MQPYQNATNASASASCRAIQAIHAVISKRAQTTIMMDVISTILNATAVLPWFHAAVRRVPICVTQHRPVGCILSPELIHFHTYRISCQCTPKELDHTPRLRGRAHRQSSSHSQGCLPNKLIANQSASKIYNSQMHCHSYKINEVTKQYGLHWRRDCCKKARNASPLCVAAKSQNHKFNKACI